MYKYQITLKNGAKVTCDEIDEYPKGISYKIGTMETYMVHDMYLKDSIEKIRIGKIKEIG